MMFFSEILGHEKIKEGFLRNLSINRISHMYIFAGMDGIGKLQFAKALAQRINCITPENADSCGHCNNCRLFQAETFPDFMIYSKQEGKRNIEVETVRKLRDVVYHTIYPSTKKRITIINDAHDLGIYGFNTLLKVMEEPPENNVIILVTSKLERFPQTVISRGTLIRFKPINNDIVSVCLQKNFGYDKETADKIAFISSGSIGQSIEYYTSQFHQFAINILNTWLSDDYSVHTRFDMANLIINNEDDTKLKGEAKRKNIVGKISLLIKILREMLLIKMNFIDFKDTSLYHLGFYENNEKFIQLTIDEIIAKIDVLYKAQYDLSYFVNPELTVYDTILSDFNVERI